MQRRRYNPAPQARSDSIRLLARLYLPVLRTRYCARTSEDAAVQLDRFHYLHRRSQPPRFPISMALHNWNRTLGSFVCPCRHRKPDSANSLWRRRVHRLVSLRRQLSRHWVVCPGPKHLRLLVLLLQCIPLLHPAQCQLRAVYAIVVQTRA